MGQLVICCWTSVMMTMVFSFVLYFLTVIVLVRNSQQDVKGNIVCYYINLNSYKLAPPEDLDSHLCTHIAYAFVNMTPDGNLVVQNKNIDLTRGTYKRITGLKTQNPKLKVLLSIGGVSAKIFSTVAAKNESRKTLAKSCKFFLETYNFDGIDVDWEKPLAKDKDNFVNLLKELREELDKSSWILSAAVFPIPSVGYDIPEVSKYVDMLNLMTYNYYGPWSAYTGQNSPLYASSIESNYEMTHLNVNASVNKWINAGASPKKINVGLAFYGRSYTLTNYTQHGLHAPFSKNHCGVHTYRQICKKFSNWTTVWDEQQMNPYKYEGDQWLSYDDEKSIREKVKYIVSNDLGGSMIWHIGGDDILGECGTKQGLLRIINEEMKK